MESRCVHEAAKCSIQLPAIAGGPDSIYSCARIARHIKQNRVLIGKRLQD